MSSKLVDFHCHLDLYPDVEAAINTAEASKIYTLTVTTTPKAWSRNRDLASGLHYVRAALGLHPQLVGERANELPLLEKYIDEARYIGEVGLDAGPRYYKSFELQKRVFKQILICCAQSGGKILSVHSVRSATPVLDFIEEYLPSDKGRVVLHWFTGSLSETRRAIELGCFFSVNAKMADSKNGKSIINVLPLDRILTETDRPFINQEGYSNDPIDIVRAVNAISNIRDIDINETRTSIQYNFNKLLTLR
jgi:TatD DNase family protein